MRDLGPSESLYGQHHYHQMSVLLVTLHGCHVVWARVGWSVAR